MEERKIPTEKVTTHWIEDRLDTLHPAHTAALVRFLTELRELFDGDLDAMLILATASMGTRGGNWRAALLQDQPLGAQMEPTNTQSISDVTRIPRETVRRKLNWLAGKGWVERDINGNWTPTRKTQEDLKPGTEATIIYLKSILSTANTANARNSNP